jgi:hypothetical protein
VRSAARLLRATARSPPRRPHAAKAVGLLCTCPVYAPLTSSIGRKNITGRRRGGGESSSKFSSSCCVCYAYALHKPLPPRVEPAARPASLALSFKSQHMLGLHTARAVCSIHGWSLVLFALVDGLGMCSAYGPGNRPI